MSETRARRVADQIKKEVSQIIGKELKDPRVKVLTSVTEVQVTRDLRYARIYVSIYGTPEEQEETCRVLTRAVGFFRSEIGRRIRLRYAPELTFELDRSMEYGEHIEQILKSIRSETEGNA